MLISVPVIRVQVGYSGTRDRHYIPEIGFQHFVPSLLCVLSDVRCCLGRFGSGNGTPPFIWHGRLAGRVVRAPPKPPPPTFSTAHWLAAFWAWILGFRSGRFAYITDVSSIPEESIEKLRGVEYLALDALRFRPHPTHFSLKQAADTATRIGARQTYLIHLCHDVDHDKGNDTLPESVRLAYDGLTLEV